jgi:hypothetical protein
MNEQSEICELYGKAASNAVGILCMMKSEFVNSTRVECVVLVKVEGPVAHYLETCHICCYAVHVLCSVHTLVFLLVLLQRKKK